MSDLAFTHLKESTAVDAAATAAIDLVRELSERDPHDKDEANPWRNPEQVFQQLDQARTGIVKAWEELHAAAAALEQTDANAANSNSSDITKEPLSTSVNEDDLRAAYMDMITDAFADVLEDMRANEAEDIDVDVLVDCLQSGLDLMSQEEKEFFMQDNEELNNMDSSNNNIDKSESNDVVVTPHELRRRELGFNMEIPSA
jgi:hypothetical protein